MTDDPADRPPRETGPRGTTAPDDDPGPDLGDGFRKIEAHADRYTESDYWRKITAMPMRVGGEIIEKSLWLYYLFTDAKTPVWAKGVIVGALGYFISPLDAIPDMIPVVGFTDDLGAIVAVLSVVAAHLTDEIKDRARRQRDVLIGDDPEVAKLPPPTSAPADGA